MLVVALFFCTFLLLKKVLSLEKEKKNEFSFCFFLAYSYLCTQYGYIRFF